MQDQNPSGSLLSLEQFTEQTSQAFFSYDVEANHIIYLNPAFEQIWKRSRRSVLENPADLLASVHPSDSDYLVKEYSKIISGEIVENIEFRIVLPDKGVKWLRLRAFLGGKAPESTTIAGYLEDVTAAKEKEEYTTKFMAKKNSVLNILAHDLAGPLNNINLASGSMAENSKISSDPELQQMIEIIQKTSERSLRLIREFVNQEFLESTNVGLVKRRYDMVGNLKEVINEYQNSEKYIKKHFKLLCSDEPIYLKVDDIKLRQAINNLVSNAIKFTPDDGEITLSIEEQQEKVLITVADNGIGIPEKYQDVLFEKFTKARRKGLKGEPSIGLGMSIIKTIVDWHNGNIWFESQENRGTKFYIELPRE
jgi:two-component system sensor histidine kinase VicK